MSARASPCSALWRANPEPELCGLPPRPPALRRAAGPGPGPHCLAPRRRQESDRTRAEALHEIGSTPPADERGTKYSASSPRV